MKKTGATAAARTDAVTFLTPFWRDGWLPGPRDGSLSFLLPTRPGTELAELYYSDLTRLADLARSGDLEADLALRVHLWQETRHAPLSPEKYDLLNWALWSPPATHSKRDRERNQDRNIIIAAAVQRVASYGFAPTRNVTTAHAASACSIVADVLEELGMVLAESTIAEIWGRYHQSLKQVCPTWLRNG